MNVPEAVIIAGPNGSGKSTLAGQLNAYGIALPQAVINPDEIVLRMQEAEPDADLRELSRRAFQEGRRLRQTYREQGVSSVLETVFSHPSGLLDMMQLRAAGFRITLAVVTTDDPEVNVRRVAGRVQQGGHGVEETKIRERHGRFMRLLPRIVEEADRVFVFDASAETRLCYQRDQIAIEFDVPDYLNRALLEPLQRRAEEREALKSSLAFGETLLLADENIGTSIGSIRAATFSYVLQEQAESCMRHDRLLLSGNVPASKILRIEYHQGEGKFVE